MKNKSDHGASSSASLPKVNCCKDFVVPLTKPAELRKLLV